MTPMISSTLSVQAEETDERATPKLAAISRSGLAVSCQATIGIRSTIAETGE